MARISQTRRLFLKPKIVLRLCGQAPDVFSCGRTKYDPRNCKGQSSTSWRVADASLSSLIRNRVSNCGRSSFDLAELHQCSHKVVMHKSIIRVVTSHVFV